MTVFGRWRYGNPRPTGPLPLDLPPRTVGFFGAVEPAHRRMVTGHPSAASPSAAAAWEHALVRDYPVTRPYGGPLTSGHDLTGETDLTRRAYRTMMWEAAVVGPLLTKTFAVASLDPQVTPEDADDPTQVRAAEFVRWSIGRSAGGWPHVIQTLALPGQVDGFATAEKQFHTVGDDHRKYAGYWTLTRLRGVDTTHLRYDIDPYSRITAVRSMRGGQGGTKFDPADFVHYTYLSLFSSPFGLSVLRPAYRPAFLIEAAVKLRSIILENYSGPFLHLKLADAQLRDRASVLLSQARARGYIVTGVEDDLAIINLATSAPDQFQATIEDLRKEISLGMRGAYLQSLESASPQGNAQTHRSQTDLFDWFLKVGVEAAINEQLVPDLVIPNFGAAGGHPTVTLGGLDPEEVSRTIDKFDATVNKLKLPASKSQFRRLTGMEPPKDDADAMGGEPPPGAGPPGMPGPGGTPGMPPVGPGGDDGGGGDSGGGGFDDLFGGQPPDTAAFAFTGEVHAKNGAVYHYREGKRIANPNAPAAGTKATPRPAGPSPQRTRALDVLTKAYDAPHTLTAEDLHDLPAAMGVLPKNKLGALTRQMGIAVGTKFTKDVFVQKVAALFPVPEHLRAVPAAVPEPQPAPDAPSEGQSLVGRAGSAIARGAAAANHALDATLNPIVNALTGADRPTPAAPAPAPPPPPPAGRASHGNPTAVAAKVRTLAAGVAAGTTRAADATDQLAELDTLTGAELVAAAGVFGVGTWGREPADIAADIRTRVLAPAVKASRTLADITADLKGRPAAPGA